MIPYLVIGYDKPLSKPINLRMERGEKIALVGANGIGKTRKVAVIAKGEKQTEAKNAGADISGLQEVIDGVSLIILKTNWVTSNNGFWCCYSYKTNLFTTSF